MVRTSKKKKLRNEADKLWYKACFKKWGRKCIACDNDATQVHHFFPRSLYGILRYDLDNGIPICKKCHFFHHHRGDPVIHQRIIARRGQEWYDNLKKKSKERKASYKTIEYYEEKIEELRNFLK